MNSLMIYVCLLLVATTSAESLSIEDRLQQVETQLSSTNNELKEVTRKNAFLQTEIRENKHEDEKNKQQIQQLLEELAEVKRDRLEDREEVKKLKSQVESQREELMEAKSRIDDLDRRIQEIQSNCCCENNQQSTATELTTEEPMNTEILVVDIGTHSGRLAVFKKLNYVAVGHQYGVMIYDLRSKQLLRTIFTSLIYDIQPFRQSQLIQSTTDAIMIWNVENGELLKTIECESCGNIYSIALNKDESLMLSGDANNRVILWDMTDYKEIRRFSGHSDLVHSVIFNEAKNQVISGSHDKTIKVWNINDGSLIRTLTGHSDRVEKILLDQETGHLYSASWDRTIKEWDVESGRELRTFTGHAEQIYDLVWSEDGKRLISSSADRSVRIWSKETGQVINRLNHNSWLYRLALNSLNGQLITTSSDKKMIFWPLKP